MLKLFLLVCLFIINFGLVNSQTNQFLIFEDNVKQNHNSQEYSRGNSINHQNLQSSEEIPAQLLQFQNLKSSKQETKTNSVSQFKEHKNSRLLQSGLPLSFDWRDKISMTPVRDQGYQCFGAWAFSTIAFFQQDQIIKNNSNSSLDLSEQYLISCDISSFGCLGGKLQTAMDLIINRKGIPPQSLYKYDPQGIRYKLICKNPDIYNISSNQSRISYYNIENSQVIQKIILKKPVNIGICAEDLFSYRPDINSVNPNDRLLQCNPNNRVIDHAVLLVGYTQKQWIIRNNWGPSWGVNGYAYISRNPSKDCGIGTELHTTGSITSNCSVQNCLICVEGNTCSQCKQGRWVKHNLLNGVETCELCTAPNCLKCSNYNGRCLTCLDDYTIFDLTGQCSKPTIKDCNYQKDNSTCYQCHKGFILSSDSGSCLPDCAVQNCHRCAQGPCTACLDGYTLNQANNVQSCVKNPCDVTHCSQCDQSGKCIKCQDYLLNTTTSQCYTTCNKTNCPVCTNTNWYCDICDPGYSYDYWQEVCFPWTIPNCYMAWDYSECIGCYDGYYLNQDDTECIQVCQREHCVTCNKDDTTICTSCGEGYQLHTIYEDTLCLPYNCTDLAGCGVCDINQTQCYQCINYELEFNYTTNQCENDCPFQNCEYCHFQTDYYCRKCLPGYALDYFSAECTPSDIPNCWLMVDFFGVFCLQCLENYEVNETDGLSCFLVCQDLNCQLCKQNRIDICTQCKGGYELGFDLLGKIHCQKIQILMPHCLVASHNQSYCFICQSAYHYDFLTQRCITYTEGCADLCQSCPDPDHHQYGCKCIQTFAWDVSKQSCGISSIENCEFMIFYPPQYYCQRCLVGYVQSDDWQSCVKSCYVDNCKTCLQNSQTVCQVCLTGYYLNSTYKCPLCTIPNCEKCNYMICLMCSIGYQAGFDGKSCNLPTCVNGTVFNGYQCTCPDGYYFSNLSCVQCSQNNCSICNQVNCLSCSQQFYLLPSGSCGNCIQHCQRCSNSTACELCNSEYFYDSSKAKCISLNNRINAYFQLNSAPIPCIEGCIQCNKSNVCTLCISKYALFKNSCIPCEYDCATCLPNIPTACLSCLPGYALVDSSCLPCKSTACVLCPVSANICLECALGYYLNLNNYSCSKCVDAYCDHCDSTGVCIQCRNGFKLINNNCEPCVESCQNCSSSVITQCSTLSCSHNQYLNINDQCKNCSNNCNVCINQLICERCQPGYSLFNNSCMLNCQSGCISCNSDGCLSCFAGYSLSSSTKHCVPDISCNQTTTCITCPEGYALINSSCISCHLSKNCLQCSNINIDFCIKCSVGYFLNESHCTQCNNTICKQCYAIDNCQVCQDGFYLTVSDLYVSDGRCLACDSDCLTCLDSPLNCLSCIQDHTLSSNNFCLNKIRIKIELTLNLQLQSFLKVSSNILSALMGMIDPGLSSDIHHILVNRIRSGSVIMNAQISIPKSMTNVTQTFKSFQKLLTTNSHLGSIQIISVSNIELINYSSDANSNSQSNASTIIIAVVIPSVIIIIVVAILLIRKRVNDENQVGNSNENSNQIVQMPQNSKDALFNLNSVSKNHKGGIILPSLSLEKTPKTNIDHFNNNLNSSAARIHQTHEDKIDESNKSNTKIKKSEQSAGIMIDQNYRQKKEEQKSVTTEIFSEDSYY